MRITDRALKAFPLPEKGYRILADDDLPGFSVRITAKGSKAFLIRYTFDGRERRLAIGPWPTWTAAKARERAGDLLRQVDAGVDPAAQKAARRAAPTFQEVADEYLAIHAPKKRSGERDRQYLEKDVLPHWGRLKAADITRRDVRALIERKAEKAPVAANRLLACVRKVYNFGIERELVDANPCYMVKAPTRESQRERILTADEIRKVWAGIEAAEGVSAPVLAALRLILITAQRPGEVASMEWSEIDGAWWTIPGAKAKNTLAHRVPLSPLALEIIQAQPQEGRYVLTPRADKPAETNALAHAVRRLDGFGVKGWTPHDLRRTAASMMTGAGVARLVVKRILNHAETDITAVYDRHAYDAEKRKALDAWGRRLRAIISKARATG